MARTEETKVRNRRRYDDLVWQMAVAVRLIFVSGVDFGRARRQVESELIDGYLGGEYSPGREADLHALVADMGSAERALITDRACRALKEEKS